jgi:UDP-N-acetylmuramoyl-tripeptide--D-alanyl-D-alanine ligase
VEVGMQSLHEIEGHCSHLIHPSIAVVTNVGSAHLELLGSQENIASAKAEVLEALPDGGFAVVPGDDDYRDFLISHAQQGIDPGKPRVQRVDVLTFGLSEDCDIRAVDVLLDSGGRPSFTLILPDGSRSRVELDLVGAHNVLDALAAAAVAYHLGLTVGSIASSLSGARVTGMRMEVIFRHDGITVIDDAYNANPDSMRAALDALSAMEVRGSRIAVLGDMGELGLGSAALHHDVGAYVARLEIDVLVCVGPLSRSVAQGAIAAGMAEGQVLSCDTLDEVSVVLSKRLHPGDCVLFKASHSMGFERLVKGLVD